jgi:hypothetical protein
MEISNENVHDTVTALSETDAAGEIAVIFADIRETMQIPMLTSIWRILAESEADLVTTWAAVKPLYSTGQPEAALALLRSDAAFPELAPVTLGEMEAAGLSASDLPAVKNIVAAYTRSNSLNLLTQTAIVADRSSAYVAYPSAEIGSEIGDLPRLLPREEISDSTWKIILDVNTYGTNSENPGLATIYRHLAYWPGILKLMQSRLTTAQEQGTIATGVMSVAEIALEEGARMANLRDEDRMSKISDHAMKNLAGYVDGPYNVARIVNIGNALNRWLDEID